MHINTLSETMTITVAVCPRCGNMEKSGTMSCCGRGGSWFKNCGRIGSTQLHHTWHEGIQACKTRSQSKTVLGQQLHVAQEKHIDSSQGAHIANYEVVIPVTKMFTFASVNSSPPMPDTISMDMSTYRAANV